MCTVGIVTARGGSKGVPRKSVRLLGGKPLMAYTIEAGLQSRLLDRVILSTDDPEMAEIGRRWGAEVPFIRPADLAQDATPTLPVLQHAVRFLEETEQIHVTAVVTLQPTSPFRTGEHIDQGLALFRNSGCDSVVSLRQATDHPYWLKTLQSNRVCPYDPNAPLITRRQDLPTVYALNGALFITRYDVLMQQNAILGLDTRALTMDDLASIDIDTEIDFRIAETILAARSEANA